MLYCDNVQNPAAVAWLKENRSDFCIELEIREQRLQPNNALPNSIANLGTKLKRKDDGKNSQSSSFSGVAAFHRNTIPDISVENLDAVTHLGHSKVQKLKVHEGKNMMNQSIQLFRDSNDIYPRTDLDLWHRFLNDGYVLIRGAISEEILQKARSDIENYPAWSNLTRRNKASEGWTVNIMVSTQKVDSVSLLLVA